VQNIGLTFVEVVEMTSGRR